MGHIPLRMCICCRKMLEKEMLVRIVKVNGNITIDTEKNLKGRGCYLCGNEECRKKLIKTKALNRVFKCDVPNEVYENWI